MPTSTPPKSSSSTSPRPFRRAGAALVAVLSLLLLLVPSTPAGAGIDIPGPVHPGIDDLLAAVPELDEAFCVSLASSNYMQMVVRVKRGTPGTRVEVHTSWDGSYNFGTVPVLDHPRREGYWLGLKPTHSGAMILRLVNDDTGYKTGWYWASVSEGRGCTFG